VFVVLFSVALCSVVKKDVYNKCVVLTVPVVDEPRDRFDSNNVECSSVGRCRYVDKLWLPVVDV